PVAAHAAQARRGDLHVRVRLPGEAAVTSAAVEDRGSVAPARLLLVLAVLGACSVAGRAASQGSPDISVLMARIGERVAGYYHRAQRLVCIETSTVQPIRTNWSWDGMARTVESELRVESETEDGVALPEARVTREIRRINGRAPRERDKTDRAGCTDPNPLSPEPLAFLLPGHRDDYRFIAVHDGRERNRAALIVEFTSANRKSRAQLVEDDRGHDDCFDWSGPIATSGRVWVDAATYDVLRVERHNDGPVDLRVSWALQRRYHFDMFLVVDRDDLAMRYKAVMFSDPDETLLLPESVESLTVVRSGLQSIRRSATLTDYRRFLTRGRVVRDR